MMKKMMTNRTLKLLRAFFLVDIVLGVFAFVMADLSTLLSTQVGFFSTVLVLLASTKSYANMVNARVETYTATADDDRDLLDKLDDPHDLYSPDISEEEAQEQDLVEVVKEARQANKASRRSFFETIKDSKASLSAYRLGAYGFLVIGFLSLHKQGHLEIIPYMLALSVPIFVMVWILLGEHKRLET